MAAPQNISSFNFDLEGAVIAVLRTVYDPEIPVNIYELGLVYDVFVDNNGSCRIVMTLTSPACPVAESLPIEVEAKVNAIEGIQSCDVEIVWEPSWNPDMMSEAAKLELGF
ncbi:MAG: DUF59 domain-containing protein [Candidatus Omnitrophota bacterium]